jgi:hypothetical protein
MESQQWPLASPTLHPGFLLTTFYHDHTWLDFTASQREQQDAQQLHAT